MTEQDLHHSAEHMTEGEENNLEQEFESPSDSPKESREQPTLNSAILQLRDGLDKEPADFVNSLKPAQARVLWEHLQKTLPGLRYATDPVADLKSGFRRMQLDSSNDPTRMLSQQEATAFMRLLKGRFSR